jgi:hypothetical protein
MGSYLIGSGGGRVPEWCSGRGSYLSSAVVGSIVPEWVAT